MSNVEFVHLHNHSEYSFLDGACRIKDMVNWASEHGAPALALTDHGNLFGVLDFCIAAKEAGLKAIYGCEVYFTTNRFDKSANSKREAADHLILLAQNETGYKHLMKLVSLAYTTGFHYVPRIDMEILSEHHEGLIALTACVKGHIAALIAAQKYDEAKEHLMKLAEVMGKDNIFLELGLHGIDVEEEVAPKIIDLSKETHIRAVATNDCHYVRAEDARMHEALLAIQTNKTLNDENRFKFSTDEFYMKTPEQMQQVFVGYPADVLRNTLEIAERCENFDLSRDENILPKYEVPEGQTADGMLKNLCLEGVKKRYSEVTPEVQQRLEHELDIIEKMGYSSYFLIVLDYINHAKRNGFTFTARGSGGGSLVLYLLEVINFDPLKFDLLFERFLNPERVSMPDIDMDFEPEHRDLMVNYLIDKYGSESVARITALSSLGARATIRRVGKVLDIPLSEVDRIAKLVPRTPGITLDEAFERVSQLRQLEKEGSYKELFSMARAIEGMRSHVSVHASGIVLSNGPLVDYVPLFKDSHGRIAAQFDMDMLEKAGMVKFDFLGQKTIGEIRKIIELIEKRHGKNINIDEISFDDEKTYDFISKGHLSGIFQLEASSGMRQVVMQIKPSNFEEYIAIPSLYRPGPIESGTMDSYIRRKLGQEPVTYPAPELESLLEPILGKTYGVCVYQEQVMQMAQAIAGFSLGQADLLRRAMSKKKAEEMQKYRSLFIEGAKNNSISENLADQMFDIIEPFAGYGFNKSHGTAYAILSYQMAYLKTHYPVEFMATLMTSESDDTEKIVRYMAECRKLGIKVLPPHINESDAGFTVSEDNVIRFGLAAVKNVTPNAVEAIVKARQNEQFTSLYDFCERVDLKELNKRVIESLIKAGAFDDLDGHRAQYYECLDRVIKQGQETQKREAIGQLSLFHDAPKDAAPKKEELPETDEWSKDEILAYEKEFLGFYLSGHPLELYEDEMGFYTTANSLTFKECLPDTEVYMAGMVTSPRHITSKNNKQMAFFTLEDTEGVTDSVVWSKVYDDCESFIEDGQMVWVRGTVMPGRSKTISVTEDGEEQEEEVLQLQVEQMLLLAEVKEKRISCVDIIVPNDKIDATIINQLKDICAQHKGEYYLILHIITEKCGEVIVEPSNPPKIPYNGVFISQVEQLLGENTVKTSDYLTRPSRGNQKRRNYV